MTRSEAEIIWRRVYFGRKWKRWFWYFVYGHDASCLAESVAQDEYGVEDNS